MNHETESRGFTQYSVNARGILAAACLLAFAIFAHSALPAPPVPPAPPAPAAPAAPVAPAMLAP